jgi:hypothetical protein
MNISTYVKKELEYKSNPDILHISDYLNKVITTYRTSSDDINKYKLHMLSTYITTALSNNLNPSLIKAKNLLNKLIDTNLVISPIVTIDDTLNKTPSKTEKMTPDENKYGKIKLIENLDNVDNESYNPYYIIIIILLLILLIYVIHKCSKK